MNESEGNAKINDTTGKWLGWIGIILGAIGLFWQPIWMGAIAIICGIIGLFSSQRILSGIAIAVGIIAIIVGLV